MSEHQGLTANQIVAANIRRGRELRGWTQEQAAERLAAAGGPSWSTASWSQAERSADRGGRRFDADEIVGLAAAFELPVDFFFAAPGAAGDVGAARRLVDYVRSELGRLQGDLLWIRDTPQLTALADRGVQVLEGARAAMADAGVAAAVEGLQGPLSEATEEQLLELGETLGALVDGAD